jgi:phosphoribosylformimino-5-aminoimidazole carboxamide ribotide isomerase
MSTIEVIPCISVYENKIARFHNNDQEKVLFYDQLPLDVALKFQDHGIKRVHILDLEGARRGRVVNTNILELISGYTDLTIDFGGGISYDDDIRAAFEHGAEMVNAASVAVNNQDLFSSWIISFGRKKIILSIDVTGETVHTRGWVKKSQVNLNEMLSYYQDHGIYYVKCSDINKDGKLSGPSFELYSKILKEFPDIYLIASGGVQSVDDIKKLQDIGVHGVIFAKAFYEGKIKLKELESFLAKG